MVDSPRAASVETHRDAAPDSVRCAVLTVSDTRTPETDSSGRLIRDLLEMRGHVVVVHAIVPDDADGIRLTLGEWASRDDLDAILSNGGTGIAGRDTTYDALVDLLEKRLDGFGELFRMLSYAEIGAAAMLSRAVAGVYRGKLVAAMPGSTNAVNLAMAKLLLPELGHLVYEIGK
ncbi:MAG: MogA/MoaB family molybdenum cofactor biosynthesis protein [Chloroflexia bacterium]|nr:MogA/MoaB family molybdenum cofactor biosynthesis protein [Chloroflexia bacterium]